MFDTNDILIIDDGSKVDYSNIKQNDRINVIQKENGKGLTHSWNIGYQYFIDNGYTNCVLSNDDVLFPGIIPLDMWKGLDSYLFIGPLSDPIGSGKFMGQFQNIDYYLKGKKDYKNVVDINNNLKKIHPKKRFLEINKDITLPRSEPPYINGFCFSFNRKIKKYEYSDGLLFDPNRINIGNEKELQRDRLDIGKAVSIKSYVFHYKGQSFKSNREEIINR